VASPFPLAAPKNKEELIRPAVDGTMHVLRAAAAASPRPRRVVVTSSTASVCYGQEWVAERPLNEDNFTILGGWVHDSSVTACLVLALPCVMIE
jgi:nucleoside-diphosphate-sugar epimerase